MSNFLGNLESLSEDELQAVANLVNKLAKRKGDKPRKNRKKRISRKEKLDNSETELIIDTPKGRKKPRKRILLDENDTVERPRKGRGRSSPRNPRNKRRAKGGAVKGRKNKGVQARTESVSLESKNKFFTMSERNSNKKDSAIDKQLWKNREASKRSEQKYEPVEVQCKECELWYDVNPSLIYNDPDHGPVYTCDDCVRR